MTTSAPDRAVWRIGGVGTEAAPITVLEMDGELYELDLLLKGDESAPNGTTDVRAILEEWDRWLPTLNRLTTAHHQVAPLTDADLKWLPPVVFPRKVIICGANYRDHVIEMGGDPDGFDHPYTSLKPPSTTLVGHRQPIIIPRSIDWIDWEGELGVVIGRRVRHVSRSEALDAVAGYCAVNDVSARDWAERPIPGVGMDWMVQKGFDSFTPAGPLLTPAQFVPDPQQLDLQLTVNGVVKQHTSTAGMIFTVAQLIEFLSSVMTLEPGDLLLTGSPSGVGFSLTPREKLEPGDQVEVSISGLSTLVNSVAHEQ